MFSLDVLISHTVFDVLWLDKYDIAGFLDFVNVKITIGRGQMAAK